MSKELSPMFFQVDPVPYSHGGTCVYICRRDVDDYATCRSAFNVDSVSKGFEEANLLNKALEEQYEMPPKYYEKRIDVNWLSGTIT